MLAKLVSLSPTIHESRAHPCTEVLAIHPNTHIVTLSPHVSKFLEKKWKPVGVAASADQGRAEAPSSDPALSKAVRDFPWVLPVFLFQPKRPCSPSAHASAASSRHSSRSALAGSDAQALLAAAAASLRLKQEGSALGSRRQRQTQGEGGGGTARTSTADVNPTDANHTADGGTVVVNTADAGSGSGSAIVSASATSQQASLPSGAQPLTQMSQTAETCLDGVTVQGAIERNRRNYTAVWEQLGHARGQGASLPTDARGLLRVRVFGYGDRSVLGVPPELDSYVNVHAGLHFLEFFQRIHNTGALLRC